MKKLIIMLAVVIGLLSSTICYAQSAKEAVRALQKLQAKTEVGVSYRDYGVALGDAKFEFNQFVETLNAKPQPKLHTVENLCYLDQLTIAKKIDIAIMHYGAAYRLWGIAVQLNKGGFIDITYIYGGHKSVEYTKIYPQLENEIAACGRQEIHIEPVLRVIWKEANKMLQEANKDFLALKSPEQYRKELKLE